MSGRKPSAARLISMIVLAIMMQALSGCANMQFPRIDPTGERVFVWPGELPNGVVGQPVASTGPTTNPFPPGGTTFVPGAPAPVVAPGGTVVATPQPTGGILDRLGFGEPGTAPPGAVPVDHLVMTPQRLIAPVGSEVILRAGICTEEGYLLTSQKMEWLLAKQGVGEFVSVGEETWYRPFKKAEKVDNGYAIGRTSNKEFTIDRGTPDPSDDIVIRDGESWVSVTSPTEGTSLVTAMAPEVGDWDRRKLTATIHWVDAQWLFPQPVQLDGASSHILTTSLSRRNDQSPIAGWVVRYEILDKGSATLGPNQLEVVDVITSDAGEASVQIVPASANAGTVRVGVQIIRPALPGSPDPIPLGNGVTTVSWGSGGTSAPPSSTPAESASLRLVTQGPGTAAIGANAPFQFQITNTGTSVAKDVRINAQFPASLSLLQSNPVATANGNRIDWVVGDLAPGETRTVLAEFRVDRAGELKVTGQAFVGNSSAGVESSAMLSVSNAPPANRPILDLQVIGPTAANVGGFVDYKFVVINRGNADVTSLHMEITYDEGLMSSDDKENKKKISTDLPIVLQPGQSTQQFPFSFSVLKWGTLCHELTVSAPGADPVTKKTCVEVAAPPAGGVPRADGAPRVDSNANLDIEILPLRRSYVGETVTVKVIVKNNGQVDLKNVLVEETFTGELLPTDATKGHASEQNKLKWTIASLPVGQSTPLEVQYKCLKNTGIDGACVIATTSVDGQLFRDKKKCFEIQPARAGGDAARAETPVSKLEMALKPSDTRIRAGTRLICTLSLHNKDAVAHKNVNIQILFPNELTPDVEKINATLQRFNLKASNPRNNVLALQPISELRPNEPIDLTLTFDANRTGNVKLQTSLSSENLSQPMTHEVGIEILQQ